MGNTERVAGARVAVGVTNGVPCLQRNEARLVLLSVLSAVEGGRRDVHRAATARASAV